ncbi:hypothetical protein CMQ_1650 [Grosmannia clavigera kw1407]|uniref:Uncharacterized protein n=1 Tax=Grosmannia clavigera (strain kw1407 / UAMH 11150) TaxID=655863 RepID=F0XDP4_GROCL|nr:uncharacterized protein CMQ_1650 [Grosmannia clavigera kw1407]EFX04722.1 hypothetical protein CMQ_1650 [Grosmannia clavigera kw1407]
MVGAATVRTAVRAAVVAMAVLARAVAAGQVPLLDSAAAAAESDSSLSSVATHGFHGRLNFSSPAPHLFASAYGLLQQWSNTVFPNGHALAGCTMPAYTLLYHGRLEEGEDEATPASPEWLALDLEMAYGIMGASRHSWMLTYQTTRPLRLLYFDGESATLMGLGQLDSQMLVLYGNVSGPPGSGGFAIMGDEYARARGLCDWLLRAGLRGRGWGYEGVVRMNAGFEIIWCDFLSDSLRLLSRLNVTAPLERVGDGETDADDTDDQAELPEPLELPGSYYSLPPVPTRTDRVADPSAPPVPPNWRGPDTANGREPFLEAQGWGWFESATWHYGSTRAGPGGGETRLRVDSCAIFSFYAPQFGGGALALARAEDEQRALNLTADGYWDGRQEGDRRRALSQLARRRRFHQLGATSVDEAAAMRQRVEQSLARRLNGTVLDGEPGSRCSGADWTLMLAEIVQRVAAHLKTMEKMLADGPADPGSSPGSDSGNATRQWLHQLRAQSHMFMVGYLEYPTGGSATTPWRPYSALFNRTLALCRYRYTRLLVPDKDGTASSGVWLSPEEADMRWAVEETYGTLCSELLTIGFDIERVWAERYGSVGYKDAGRRRQTDTSIPRRHWADRLAELIVWLGWEGEFIGCSRACDWDERCFIPMWPMLNSQWGRGGPDRGPGGGYGHGRPHDGYGHGGPRGGHGQPKGPEGSDGPRGPPSQNGSYGPPNFRFPRTPAMMGNDTDLWEPKCVKAWYL